MSDKLSEFLEILNDTNKTCVMAVLLCLGAIFRIRGLISGQEMVDLWKVTTVSFFGTTTALHIGNVIKDHLAGKLEELKNQGKASS